MKSKTKRISPIVRDAILRAHWDENKSYDENMKSLDLSIFSGTLGDCISEKKKPTLPEPERRIIERLIKKYNTDTYAMYKDMKLNRWQWRRDQIEERIERLKSGHIAKDIGFRKFDAPWPWFTPQQKREFLAEKRREARQKKKEAKRALAAQMESEPDDQETVESEEDQLT